MPGVLVPKDHLYVGEKIVGYVDTYRGQKMVNIRKLYERDGEEFIGKGLCLNFDDWKDLASNWNELEEYLEKEIDG